MAKTSIRDISARPKGVSIRLRHEDEFGRTTYSELPLLAASEARGWSKCLLAAAEQVELAERDAILARKTEIEQLEAELARQKQALDAQLCDFDMRDGLNRLVNLIPVHDTGAHP